ncbi:MAG TPA: hypothetical protein VD866_24965 [Urbifossiella sp.]|nr:hypothetical protein [Urbifossiella sp.]
MTATLSEPATLALLPPVTVAYGPRRAVCGIRVYLALRCLTRAADRVTFGDLIRAVWGAGAVIRRDTVKALTHRCNQVLARVGCPLRAAVEGDEAFLI